MSRAPDRCPKCGSTNIIGYMGEYECMDCGYKFTIGASPSKIRRPQTKIYPKTALPRRTSGRGKWIAALVIIFLLGIFFGYGIGFSGVKTVTSVAYKTISETKTITIVETKTITSTVGKIQTALEESPYHISLTKTIIDPFLYKEKDILYLYVIARYTGPGSWKISPHDFEAIGDSGKKYDAVDPSWIYSPDEIKNNVFDPLTGEGYILFSVDKGDSLKKIIYTDQLRKLTVEIVDIPTPSNYVITITRADAEVKSPKEYNIWPIIHIKECPTYTCRLLTNQEIHVNVTIGGLFHYTTPIKVKIKEIKLLSPESGKILAVNATMPLETVISRERKLTFNMKIKLPSKPWKGELKIQIILES